MPPLVGCLERNHVAIRFLCKLIENPLGGQFPHLRIAHTELDPLPLPAKQRQILGVLLERLRMIRNDGLLGVSVRDLDRPDISLPIAVHAVVPAPGEIVTVALTVHAVYVVKVSAPVPDGSREHRRPIRLMHGDLQGGNRGDHLPLFGREEPAATHQLQEPERRVGCPLLRRSQQE